MATDIKKFLDQGGVSTLWAQVAANVAAEKARAEAAEAAALKAAQDAQADVDALETYVGTIPADYTESNIVAFIQKRAQEVLAAAQGGSSETAASVKAALDAYIASNDKEVDEIGTDVATILADYLKKADKDELAADIKTNADEILRIDNALKLAVENNEDGIDSIKELATWVNTHGTEAAGYAAAISALETLVGDTAVATQIANAIAAENLSQYAKTADIEGTLQKVDTQGTVTEAINAAITALAIGDYAKAADLTALAARVTTLEQAGYQNANQVTESINAAITALKAENLWDTKGAAATAESNAKAHADGLNTAMDARVAVLEAIDHTKFEAAGAAAQALTDAKSYTDTEVAKIQALSEAEILAAINSVAQA